MVTCYNEKMKDLLIFHHIQKTAGSSLANIVRENYAKDEILGVFPNQFSVDWYRKFYDSLSAEQRTSVRCIAAHSAHFIIPTLIEKQHPFQVFCLFRDPVDRALSLYHFCKKRAFVGQGRGAQKGKKIYELNWKIEDIYLNLGGGSEKSSELHEIFKEFFNYQTRSVLAPYINTEVFEYIQDSQKIYEEQVDAILQKYYTVGVQEKFSESVELFAQKFGWKNLPDRRDNIGQYSNELSKEVADLIRSYNALDSKIHRHYFDKIK